MQKSFNRAITEQSRVAARQALDSWRYTYVQRDDGMLEVSTIDIARKGLTELPDLSCVIVTGNFYCQDNKLRSLKGAPAEVHGGFWCNGNRLETLAHMPQGISGQCICHDNRLTSLKGAPAEISGDFTCQKNPLTSLEGAPAKFYRLRSDFGEYTAWNEVPDKIRLSPENYALALEGAAKDATVLQGALRVSKPLRLKHS